jgi:hypothetical protein
MVAPPQHVALTRVTSTPLPSLWCVAPAGSAEGEHQSASRVKALTQGLLLHFRFNSTLPQSPQRRKHRRARKYSRLQLTAAAAVAAGALGATGLSVGTASWSAAIGNVTGTAHTVSRAPAGQAGSSAVDSVIGMKSRAAAANPWQPLSQAAGVQLDSQQVSAAASAAGTRARTAHTSARRMQAAHASAARSAAAQANAAHSNTAQAHAGQARQAKDKAAQPQQVKAKAATAAPYLIYDSISPTAIPAKQRVATYVNGAYAASSAAVAGRGSVLWIDTNGSDPAASALDVEPGDATPAGAAQWVDQKLTANSHGLAIVYTMQSEWQQVKDSIVGLPAWMQSRVRYWIADPTGVPHMVPGSSATQWYWGNSYDITTANPDFQIG